ncbi:Multi-sensor signal transduction histidine kinase [Candidatus Terasakiella magnetica]|nr:Multi-sensor signal transduction histidine kinase [Candidatus Terasakiella magnetica]
MIHLPPRSDGVRPLSSLRLRLLVVSVVVEMVMLTLLVANGARLIQEHLLRNTVVRVQAQEASFNITLAGLLASRDYAALQSVLDGWGAIKSITYMAVVNSAGKMVAATNWSEDKPLPPPDRELNPAVNIHNGAFDITFLGQRYGRAHYGLDTTFLGLARHDLLQQSIAIAVVEVVLTLGLLAAIGYWLTRHLDILTRASLKVASGDFSLRLKLEGSDEISVLTQAFNTMSSAVESRISELDQSQQRFRAIADYTYAWENWIGSDGALHWVNPAVERITGYSVGECEAMTDFPLPMVLDEDRPKVRTHMDEARTGGSGQDAEFRILRRDGKVIWVAMSWQPIFNQEGRALGSRSSIRDITLQKESGDMLLEAKGELERMVFAASHDLQEPIRQIQTFVQRLQRDLGDDIPHAAMPSLDAIREGATQLGLQVKGMLDYSRSTRAMSAFVPVDIKGVVESVATECGSMAPKMPPVFTVGDLPVVPGDPVLLSLLFENLIGNAVKFSRPGIAPEIAIAAVQDGAGWRIDIADNGIGIDPEYLGTIIRPFSRLYSRSTFPGAGLGLASAAKVARVHGGRLWLDSDAGGTTARLWLPARH